MASPQPFAGLSALLVDDHPDVLVGVGAYLKGAGFDVTRVRTGDEALSNLMSGQSFNLLITDYAMPGLNGVELAKQGLERCPEMKALIITGYPSDAGLFNRPASVAILAKPFRRSALIDLLQSLLAVPQSSTQTASGTPR